MSKDVTLSSKVKEKESLPSNVLLNTELNKITSQSSDKGLI